MNGKYVKFYGFREIFFIECFRYGFYWFSGPPFPPKYLMQIFPKGALPTSVYLRWKEIPVAEQGGGLNNYEISYWVKGQPRAINKTDLPIGLPTADADGYISYEIKNLQTGLEYLVAVYGENKYSTDVLDRSYYSSEIFVKPSFRRM